MFKNIIFDLDGTIIDSAPGIEESFKCAYKNVYHEVCNIEITKFIGPPINQVLTAINGESDEKLINLFTENFKFHYDNEGYKLSKLYKGVKEVLESLVEKKYNVFIATNKRQHPTSLILKLLSIDKFFKNVYCPDSLEKIFNNKSEIIAYILNSNSLLNTETLLVGDTNHDGIAAENNNINFALAKYGYGEHEKFQYQISNIKQLINFI
jgi:phosphoglycolate phosphatase